MPGDWQDLAALLVVGGAAAYLARIAARALKARGGGCVSGCGSCPSNTEGRDEGEPRELVTLAPSPRRSRSS